MSLCFTVCKKTPWDSIAANGQWLDGVILLTEATDSEVGGSVSLEAESLNFTDTRNDVTVIPSANGRSTAGIPARRGAVGSSGWGTRRHIAI